MSSSDSETQTYAWNWFSLHAGQRLQMVNFWLVSVAFLAAAFVQAVVNKLFLIAFGVAIVGAMASAAFMRLDVRTRQLVHVGEAALVHLEKQRAATGQEPVLALATAAGSVRASRLDSYRYLIQGLQMVVAVAFTLAAIHSLISA